MDRQERQPSPVDAMALVLRGWQAGLWTAMPGIVKAFRTDSASGCVVDVQPSIQLRRRLTGPDGNYEWVSLPLIPDCPVMFPGGGGFTLTFPIKEGDECLLVFANRCIDAWFEAGGDTNQQAELRMHDLSDGFAFVGVRSKPRTLDPEADPDDVQLRSDDGQTKISIKDDLKVDVVAPAEITLTAPLVKVNGNMLVTGLITSGVDVVAPGGITLLTHITSGVDDGTETSGPPVAP